MSKSIEGRSNVLASWMTSAKELSKPEHKFIREEMCSLVSNFTHFGCHNGQMIVKFDRGYAILQRNKQHPTVIEFDVLVRPEGTSEQWVALYDRVSFWYNQYSVQNIADRARANPNMRRDFDVLYIGGDVDA